MAALSAFLSVAFHKLTSAVGRLLNLENLAERQLCPLTGHFGRILFFIKNNQPA
jgi:hypothetical protein